MNVRMWEHKATQKNLNKLFSYGYKFIGPKMVRWLVVNMEKERCLVLDK